MAKFDYYQALYLDRTASPEEISSSHRRLVKLFHDDYHRNETPEVQKYLYPFS